MNDMNNKFMLYKCADINADTKIIRFVDLGAGGSSIGCKDIHSGKLKYSITLNTLSHYKKMKSSRGDRNEGKTAIDHGKGTTCFSATCNDALISCWSLLPEKENPWDCFKNTIEPSSVYGIVSTVGKVKRVFEQIMEENKERLNGVLSSTYGKIEYYPKGGVPVERWDHETEIRSPEDVLNEMYGNVYHKPESYTEERELRFAIILQPGFNPSAAGMINPALSTKEHYIDKLYCRSSLEAICNSMNIELIHVS
jgi:hypothetical protein